MEGAPPIRLHQLQEEDLGVWELVLALTPPFTLILLYAEQRTALNDIQYLMFSIYYLLLTHNKHDSFTKILSKPQGCID